jgi:NAD(P)-dependent dehydrogenase (short-subunit alcohol dehydrogenase family)
LVEDELGPIDVWVNNAMTSVFAPFEAITMEEFTRAIEVNLLGFVHGTRTALDVMATRDRGAIVQVGSALAYRGIPLQSAYCTAKHGIVGFTEAVRTELLHQKRGIDITMVHMPAMNTPQFDWVRSRLPRRAQPVPPIYQPEVGARAVVYAANHPKRRAYYVGLSTTLTVLGNKVIPGLLDRYLARTGFDSQQTDEDENQSRPDNLTNSVSGPFGARGRFDRKAHECSPWSAVTRVLRR